MTKSKLQSLPLDGRLVNFALCIIKEKLVLLTGGCNNSYNNSDKVYLLDTESGHWLVEPA